jgi:uncharacterized phage protein (TIGR01671 family)
MREILFRGKRGFDKEWVFGGLVPRQDENKEWIYDRDDKRTCYAILVETRGQYTGLDDKNGVKIFEGDIVRLWTDTVCAVSFRWGAFYVGSYIMAIPPYSSLEVIGNIHDNPELLEEKNDRT